MFKVSFYFINCKNGNGGNSGIALLGLQNNDSSNRNIQAYLKAPNNSDFDEFGLDVAISDNTIVVGAYNEASNTTSIINGNNLNSTNDAGLTNGAAYVFVRTGSTWSHQAYLKAPNSNEKDEFARSVAISGDTIVVGAPRERSDTTVIINGNNLSTTNNDGLNTGAAYVFVRSGSTWSLQAYLKAPNNIGGNDNFGNSVAISGDTIVVGARFENGSTTSIINGSDLSAADHIGDDNGAAYVFVRSGSNWSHQAYLKSPNNSNSDLFGNSVAISGDTIVVGAYGETSSTSEIINGNDLSGTNDNGAYNGAVYVFMRSGSNWSHQAYLKAPNNSNNDYFSYYSIGISGDTIVVGSQYEDSDTKTIINGDDLSGTNDSGNNNGGAYVFVRNGSTWSHQAYLKGQNTSSSDTFGSSVAISGNTIVVGAKQNTSEGAAYIFVRSGSMWSQQSYLKAPNASWGDKFGCSVSLSGSTIVVGAWEEQSTTTAVINGSNLSSTNNDGNFNGAAYVYKLY